MVHPAGESRGADHSYVDHFRQESPAVVFRASKLRRADRSLDFCAASLSNPPQIHIQIEIEILIEIGNVVRIPHPFAMDALPFIWGHFNPLGNNRRISMHRPARFAGPPPGYETSLNLAGLCHADQCPTVQRPARLRGDGHRQHCLANLAGRAAVFGSVAAALSHGSTVRTAQLVCNTTLRFRSR